MAVQKNKVTRSKRGLRRAHDGLKRATLSEDPTTGETHRRHHVTGRRILSRQKGRPDRRRLTFSSSG
ncbi:MAG: 50S ribosomal protein L32 [Gammaproteobacteria bacterium]|nr:50S ribosomal protein L32 [Gammaproteobacteria bacterium]